MKLLKTFLTFYPEPVIKLNKFLNKHEKNCIYIFCPCEEHDRLSVHFSLKSFIKLDTNTQVNEVPYNESAEYKKLTH